MQVCDLGGWCVLLTLAIFLVSAQSPQFIQCPIVDVCIKIDIWFIDIHSILCI